MLHPLLTASGSGKPKLLDPAVARLQGRLMENVTDETNYAHWRMQRGSR
jgi:hypothetical protein